MYGGGGLLTSPEDPAINVRGGAPAGPPSSLRAPLPVRHVFGWSDRPTDNRQTSLVGRRRRHAPRDRRHPSQVEDPPQRTAFAPARPMSDSSAHWPTRLCVSSARSSASTASPAGSATSCPLACRSIQRQGPHGQQPSHRQQHHRDDSGCPLHLYVISLLTGGPSGPSGLQVDRTLKAHSL